MKTYFRFFFSALVVVILIIACAKSDKSVSLKNGSSYGWTESEKKTFLDDCSKGPHTGISDEKITIYCDCMLEKMMAKYKKYAYTTGRTREEFKNMMDSCDAVAGIE